MLQITGYELLSDNTLRLSFDKGFGITQYLVLDLGLNFEPGAAAEITQSLTAATGLTLEPLLIEGILTGDLTYTDVDGNTVSLSDRLISQSLAEPRPQFTGHWADISDPPAIPVAGVDYVAPSSLATVATTGSYNDLSDKPEIPVVPLSWPWNSITGKPAFSTVATTGSYNSLSDRPTIPSIPATWPWANITGKPAFATVATSGSYNDLSGRPTIPTIPATWAWADITGKPTIAANTDQLPQGTTNLYYTDARVAANSAVVANTAKRTYPSADQTKLAGIATGAEVNVQANWNETNAGSDAFILNKPTIPTIPATWAWASITGKPSFSTVATSGSYNDLSDKPYIPSAWTDFVSSAGGIFTGSVIVDGLSIGRMDTSDVPLIQGSTFGSKLTSITGGQFVFRLDDNDINDGFQFLSNTSLLMSIRSGNDTLSQHFSPISDASQRLGSSSNRWRNLYLFNNPIVTSDAREKQGIRDLSSEEIAAVFSLRPKIWAWADEGDRLHCGAIAQEVADAFSSNGLNPYRYSVNCRDQWWEYPGGKVSTLDQVPEEYQGEAVQRDRLGIRPDELFGFAIAALVVEVQQLKTRVSALENGGGA